MEYGERMATLEAWSRGHEKQCDEDRRDIKANTVEIKTQIADLARDIRSATQRIHARMDQSQADTDTKLVQVNARMSKQKATLLSAVVVFLITVLGYVLSTWGPLAPHQERAAVVGTAAAAEFQ